jgi:predicted nucleic acid-binding protein
MGQEEEPFRIVIDTNILIGALIRDNSYKARLIKSSQFLFFYPDYGIFEIEKFRDYICTKREKKPGCAPFEYAIKFLLESVTVVPNQLYTDMIPIAHRHLAEIDPKDTPFLALALHMNCPLWSDDAHLKQQSLVPCYSTREFTTLLKR